MTDYTQQLDSVKPADLFFSNLRSDNWQTFNVDVAKATSHTFSILLAVIASKFEYYERRGKLTDHPVHGKGWFYLSRDDVYEMTGLTRYEQETAVKLGKKLKIIECENFGLPQRRHFRINKLNLYECVIKFKSTKRGCCHQMKGDDEKESDGRQLEGGDTPAQLAEKPPTGHIYNPIQHPVVVVTREAEEEVKLSEPPDKPMPPPSTSPPNSVQVKSSSGKTTQVTRDDLYRLGVSKDWSPSEINTAWEAMAFYQGRINDWTKWTEGVVKSTRLNSDSANGGRKARMKTPSRKQNENAIPKKKFDPSTWI